ncbi:putative Zn(II)2Cys6 transcription factor [Chaetomium strumarium]|uniref:Zn(II)2Cys6 transcription factor n=1 Tax=Chaetomium strumarium TaxID=1170767 RepID=A0AAJ0GYE5_9PEZI|nr:putative Zn(II)2Cys6 transcription factor [Chaetomium strumarium]
MTETRTRAHGSPPIQPEAEPPRKKVRKGTRSCWECKRRKIKCVMEGPAETLCQGCKGRGTACIGQEFPDVPTIPGTPGTSSKQVGVEDRLGRVETLVEQLVEHLVKDKDVRASGAPKDPDLSDYLRRDCPPRPVPPLTPATSEVQHVRSPFSTKYAELSHKLCAAWPSQRDIDLLLSVPVGTAGFLLEKASCAKRLNFSSPREILRLAPLPGDHPTLIARRLFFLAIFLRGVPSSVPALGRLSVSYRQLMTRAAEAAGLVTSNDALVSSLEGIECIVMDIVYQDDAGNIRGAWMAARRAIAMAQMLGIHRVSRGTNSSSPQVLEPESRTRLDPKRMWFRLVQTDLYLSLMLGLPPASSDTDIASQEALEGCTAVERMRRFHCAATARILQRNDDNMRDSASTYEVDGLLQKASASMPPQWWLPPTFSVSRRRSGQGDDLEVVSLDEWLRVMDQLVHYHLLERLHMPYLLCSAGEANDSRMCTYSRITALTASREVLSRFVSFRSANPTGLYCTHCLNFLPFTSSSILCLAHIEAWRRRHAQSYANSAEGPQNREANHSSAFDFFIHQRPNDRGLVERTVECLDQQASAHADAVALKMATILRHLLALEEDAANGGTYHTSSRPWSPGVGEDGGESGDVELGRMGDGGKALRIRIPHFGIIELERVEQQASHLLVPADHLAVEADDWTLQGVDMAFENLIRGVGEPDGVADEQWARWDGL